MQKKWASEKFGNKTILLNYSFILLIFVLNFLGLPQLKYLSLAYTLFAFIAVFVLDFKVSLLVILSFCFLEGQGRILWNYHPFFRLAFDSLVAIAVVMTLTEKRNFKLFDLLPKAMLVFFVLHVMWYAVEIFNIYSISMLAPLAAAKIYLFPFLVIIMLRLNEKSFTNENINSICTLVVTFMVLESALALFQLQSMQTLMLSISPYYERAMKGDIFILDRFRPFGTTHLPGAVSVYLFLSTGFLFLRKKISKRSLILIVSVLTLIFLTLLVCQVRSAMVKYVILLLGSIFSIVITSKQRLNLVIRISLIGLVLISVLIYQISSHLSNSTETVINLESGLKRWENLDSFESIKSKRAGPIQAFNIMLYRLENFPIGIGPGMTGAAGSFSSEEKKKDPVYDKNIFWGYDNFYLSMIVEFGYGCIFYLSFIFCVPVILFRRFRKLYKDNHLLESRIVLISLIHVSVILIGNWGAIGLPYNPESFFFWFWTAIGLNVYSLAKKNDDELIA